jgi:hypothetical protein
LKGDFGDAHPIEARRALKEWSDPASGGDWNQNPAGGPTWRDHAHPSAPWTSPGAGALGGTGGVAGDYDGSFDLAQAVDATAAVESTNGEVVLSGAKVTEAFRFWFDNPSLDHGYALRLAPGAKGELKFRRGESDLRDGGPVLTLTYDLPGAPQGENEFERGDCNGDGTTSNISDPVFLLSYNFSGTQAPPCLAACDANGDGEAVGQVSDAIYMLNYLFLGGPPPVPPFPGCGPGFLETDANLGCDAESASCA